MVARRIVSIVELADGSFLVVELHAGAIDPLEFEFEVFPSSGSTYLGDGRWNLRDEEVFARIHARGVHRVARTDDPLVLMAQWAGIGRDGLESTVNGPLPLESGQ